MILIIKTALAISAVFINGLNFLVFKNISDKSGFS